MQNASLHPVTRALQSAIIRAELPAQSHPALSDAGPRRSLAGRVPAGKRGRGGHDRFVRPDTQGPDERFATRMSRNYRVVRRVYARIVQQPRVGDCEAAAVWLVGSF
jgi:hypothetical protein